MKVRGLDKTGKKCCSDAINAAIKKCKKGGIVELPSGTFRITKPINLKP